MAASKNSPSSPRILEMSGTHIVLFVLIPAALIGGIGFLLLAPIITAKQPGSLYLGVRFADESTLQFVDRNGTNPLTRLDLFHSRDDGTPESDPALSFEGLRRGKNIIPIADLPDGLYRLRFSSPGYRAIWVLMEMQDGDFRPPGLTRAPEGVLSMDQFVGIELRAAQPVGQDP